MSNFNFLIYLNAYSDRNPSNNPSKNNFRWERALNSIPVGKPSSLDFSLAPGETKTVFDGTRVLTQDGTTEYSIAPAMNKLATYQLTWVGGTSPSFRTARTTGADSTTSVTVTLNGPVVTFTSTSGTNFDLISGGVVVGDWVNVGNLFNLDNQGMWQIIAVTATSFSVANLGGVAEGPIALGAGFASQVDIYSSAGVQINDTLVISGGFSPVTQGSYVVTAVTDGWVQFSTTAVLPVEGPILTEGITIYSDAQRLVYLESDQHVTMSLNSSSGDEINPLIVNGCNGCQQTIPGMFLRTSIVYSMTVTNVSQSTASLFFAAIE
jgi:hypothetical protein